MKIEISQSTVAPMLQWLRQAVNGCRDEAALRALFAQPDYQVEFARYASGLPVCGINLEEAVDFFLHFDQKQFENPRLAYKQEAFLQFLRELDSRQDKLAMLQSITEEDMAFVRSLLENALPAALLEQVEKITILLTVSIGNSMGWPYEDYVHFDVAGLDAFPDKESFLHVLAHEIHHIIFPRMICENMTPQQYFYVNFAFEGLAVHFCNNAATAGKAAKYPGRAFCMQEEDMAFYRAQHKELLQKVLADGEKAKTMTMEQVEQLVSQYEQFTFTSLKTGETRTVQQYPTYYMGCFLWGLIDQRWGKEKLYQVLCSENGFPELLPELHPEQAAAPA